MLNKKFYTQLLCIMSFAFAQAQTKEFTHPQLFSFEKSAHPLVAGKSSNLSLTADHYKHQSHSLKWDWSEPKSEILMSVPIGYLKENPNPKETSVSTFVFWVYSEKNIPGEKLKFEFLKNGKVCSYFEYGTNFSGWRGAWIAFDRDMQGAPEEGMDQLRITAPNTAKGTLFLDHIIPSSFQDVRQHTADFQAPYINRETNSHWLILLNSWNNKFDLPISTSITQQEIESFSKIEKRLTDFILTKKRGNLEQIRKQFTTFNIKENPNGSVTGEPLFFERYGETYINMGGARNYASLYTGARSLKFCNEFMFNIAASYNSSSNEAERTELAKYFILLTRHMLDQGFQAGSALGTLHHLGYSMRNYYTAAFLMKDVLKQAGLQSQVQQAMEWFAGTGEVKKMPTEKGMDIDAFNTSLIGRLSSILIKEDTAEKTTYMRSFTRWVNNGLDFAEGTAGCFKTDGSIFHHRHNYPAYAVGGLDGGVNVIYLLQKTDFAISPASHENLKQSLLAMRRYCNLTQWPLSISGRHPDGKGELSPPHFGRLALAGSPDRKEEIDAELASAYLRLAVADKKSEYVKILTQAGFEAEKSPEGNWNMNYSCLAIHRRDNWLATAMGHSRYLWATESYLGANIYGRYLNHGSLQIMASGSPITNFSSGFNPIGWDWNHFPGTTATVVALDQLRADIRNVDTNSGYEEMLLSDETFAGAISNRNKNGAFGLILHEHDKYNGSLRARKSYFFFDNRIVALGSNIESKIDSSLTMTTLFQQYLPNKTNAIEVNGSNVTEFPYAKTFTGNNSFADGKNNIYYVRNSTVKVHRKEQLSRDEETEATTKNNFALAAISHGKAPSAATYEYMVLVQPNLIQRAATNKAMAQKTKIPYTVVQQDKQAHIVHDKASQTTGYVLFEAGNIPNATELESNDIPCLVMTHRPQKDSMTLSVCDPDLRFYEGKADEVYDENGKRTERSVYSRKWINNPSGKSTITLVIKGKWKAKNTNEYIQVKACDNKTTLSVSCQDGATREIELTKL